MKLIVRADDFGYSKAVSIGIAEAVKNGIINNVGLMTNMEEASFGVSLLKNENVCLGMHANISAGFPVMETEKVPNLVGEDGRFRTSSSYREAVGDIALKEAEAEVEAQYEKFVELTSRKPGYIDGHAVISPNFFKALELVAKNHDILYCPFPDDFQKPFLIGNREVYLKVGSTREISAEECLKIAVEDEEHLSLVVYHPGYVDAAIMRRSSLNLQRIYELEMLCSDETKKYLAEHDVHLMRFDEL